MNIQGNISFLMYAIYFLNILDMSTDPMALKQHRACGVTIESDFFAE